MAVLLALRPAVVCNAAPYREVVEKLIRVPARQIVLAGIPDPERTGRGIHRESDSVTDALRAKREGGAVGLHHRDRGAGGIDLDAGLASSHGRVARRSRGDVDQAPGVRDGGRDVTSPSVPGATRPVRTSAIRVTRAAVRSPSYGIDQTWCMVATKISWSAGA